jgi:membrane-associated PAP2 superfamily phosphatase
LDFTGCTQHSYSRTNLIILPLLVSIVLVIVLQYCALDDWLAAGIYQQFGGWTLKDAWLLQKILHQGGRVFVALMIALMSVLALVSFGFLGRKHRFTLSASYAFCATVLSILVVSTFKQITTLPCPWDVIAFGGGRVNTQIGSLFSWELPVGHCFPSGHASGGFALFSLFFAVQIFRQGGLLTSRSAKNYWWLVGLLVGGVFGITQQLRGAHFLSHDVASAAICWLVCALLWWFFYAPLPEASRQNKSWLASLTAYWYTANTQVKGVKP